MRSRTHGNVGRYLRAALALARAADQVERGLKPAATGRREHDTEKTYYRGCEFVRNAILPHDAQKYGGAVDLTNYLISILISLIVGIVGFIAAYKIFDWLTPGVDFSDQLNSNNQSVAIFLAGLFIGLGILLGNAIK
jgi:hypothetical protein